MNFSPQGNAEEKTAVVYPSKYLQHGKEHIGSIEHVELGRSSQKQTPFIKLTFVASNPTENLNNNYHPVPALSKHQYAEKTFYITERAMDPKNLSSLARYLRLIARNVNGSEDAWDGIAKQLTSLEEYQEAISNYFGGLEFAALIDCELWNSIDKNGLHKENSKSVLRVRGSFARSVSNVEELRLSVKNLITAATEKKGSELNFDEIRQIWIDNDSRIESLKCLDLAGNRRIDVANEKLKNDQSQVDDLDIEERASEADQIFG